MAESYYKYYGRTLREDDPCPSCLKKGKQGQMVLRTSNKSKFLGCSNYPSCKQTSNSDSRLLSLMDKTLGEQREKLRDFKPSISVDL